MTLNREEIFYMGNLCRKLLESFLSFKYPKKRGDFKLLFDSAIKQTKIDSIDAEVIYRFVNRYSHNQNIDIDESITDDLFAEGKSIVQGVLDIVKELYIVHYQEMESVIAG